MNACDDDAMFGCDDDAMNVCDDDAMNACDDANLNDDYTDASLLRVRLKIALSTIHAVLYYSHLSIWLYPLNVNTLYVHQGPTSYFISNCNLVFMQSGCKLDLSALTTRK